MSKSLTGQLVAPVADEEDARASATAINEYPRDRHAVVSGVENGGGLSDTLSVEQAELLAEDSFAVFRDISPATETELPVIALPNAKEVIH